MYSYQESARKHGSKVAIIGSIIVLVCLSLIAIIFGSRVISYSNTLYILVLLLMSIPGFSMLVTGSIEIVKGGTFIVSVSSEKIIWIQPKYLGKSFELTLSQIDFIERVIRKTKNGKTKTKYNIVDKKKEKYKLSKQSGVSIEKVAKSLISNQVELRETYKA